MTIQTIPIVLTQENLKESGAEQMLALLTLTEEISSTEAEKTNAYFEEYRKEMEGRFAALSEDNLRLSVALVGSTSREREIEMLHRAELEALRGEVASLKQTVVDMREEMVATAQKAGERVAAAMQAQEMAVQTAIAAGRSQTEASCHALRSELQQKQLQLEQIFQNLHGLVRGIEGQRVKYKATTYGYNVHKDLAAGNASDMLKTMAENIRDPTKKVQTYPQYSGCSVM